MVYIAVYKRSHGHKKFRESRHTDKQTISFFNGKIYSDRPVFTPRKEIRTIFASSEAT